MPSLKLEECTGCGACVAACTAGAIRLTGSAVEIDAALCNKCGACVAACPTGALVETVTTAALAVTGPSGAQMPAVTAPVLAVARPSGTQAPVVSAPAFRRLVPLAGATMAFLGREVAPRLLDLLITTLERRLDAPVSVSGTNPQVSRRVAEPGGSGLRRRHRGGRLS